MKDTTPRPMTEAEQDLLSDPPAERLADGDARPLDFLAGEKDDGDDQGNTEGDTMDNPTEERSDLERRELTPAEWRRVARVIDFIRAQPKAADPAQGEAPPTEPKE